MDYNIIHGSLLVITLVLFVFGMFFFGKLRAIRYIFWVLSAVLLIYYINISIDHNRATNKAEKETVGWYSLDTNNSIYNSKKIEGYNNTVLNIKEGNTFELNQDVPFFDGRKGSWTYFYSGDMSGIRGKFDKSGSEFEIYENPGILTFSSANMKNANDSDEIIFVRH